MIITTQKFQTQNITKLINTLNLKTDIIDKECIIRFLKLILDGPKYLSPLSEGTVVLSFAILASDPEKLLQVAFSFSIFLTINFGMQV